MSTIFLINMEIYAARYSERLMHHDYIMSATSTIVVGHKNDENKSLLQLLSLLKSKVNCLPTIPLRKSIFVIEVLI